MTRTLFRRGVVALVGSALTLSACSSSPQEGTAAACDALSAYSKAVTELASALTPTATVDQLKSARESVDGAQKTLDDAVKGVQADRLNEVKSAWENAKKQLQDLDGDATLASAADTLKAATSVVQQKRSELSAAVECPS